jgi:hypothetical protein
VQQTLATALRRNDSETSVVSTPDSGSSTPIASILKQMPGKRYVGSFGVTGWATKSGSGMLKHEEVVTIERQKDMPKVKKSIKRVVNLKKVDIIVRFLNSRGEEVGRLENESATWISALLDQQVCTFQGTVVYTPDRLRTGDNVFLQLRAFFLRSAFDSRKFVKPEDNREVNLFEEKESSDERDLRRRQVALVKLPLDRMRPRRSISGKACCRQQKETKISRSRSPRTGALLMQLRRRHPKRPRREKSLSRISSTRCTRKPNRSTSILQRWTLPIRLSWICASTRNKPSIGWSGKSGMKRGMTRKSRCIRCGKNMPGRHRTQTTNRCPLSRTRTCST